VAPGMTWAITNLENATWQPAISPWKASERNENYTSTPGKGGEESTVGSKAFQALEELGGKATPKLIGEKAGLSSQQVYRQLGRAQDRGQVKKQGAEWIIP
jgi:hypothetical protein